MRSFTTPAVLAALSLASAQNVTVSTTCGNYSAGTDEVLFTLPYTYDQVISIIGNYSNLTWSGSPPGSVSLNGTDNTVGTARTYDLSGLHVIETILQYSKPPSPGPYNEVHNTATLMVPSPNVSLYIPYDGTVVSSVCDGKATQMNFTAHFCATNSTLAAGLLHMLHLTDAQTVGTFLGGKNYTGCAALGASGSSGPMNATAPNGTSSGGSMSGSATSASPAASTNAADGLKYSGGMVVGMAGVLMAMAML